MDIPELRSALSDHLFSKGYTSVEESDSDLFLLLVKGGERLGLALCADREEHLAFLGSFEAAMQRLMDASRVQTVGLSLGLGIDFASTAAGKHPSYRPALKKYSNSIVFEDLGLSLFLAKGEGEVLTLAPVEVNPFLRELDRWIAEQKK